MFAGLRRKQKNKKKKNLPILSIEIVNFFFMSLCPPAHNHNREPNSDYKLC